MDNVKLFTGERLELGDMVLHTFAANINMVYEVIGVNPEFAIICRKTHQGLDIDHEIKIPLIFQEDENQAAYRPVNMEAVTLH